MIEAAVPFADSFDHECTAKENNSEEEKTFYCTSFFLGLKIAKLATGFYFILFYFIFKIMFIH